MSEIKIPSWMLPVFAGGVPAAIAFGSMQAMSQATDEELKRVTDVVEKVAEKTDDNTKKTALNEQAIQQIADGLSRQVEISQATDEKLGTLIELMLKERR